jgi:four helix bundle protein
MAYSSLMEVLNQLIISKELNFIAEDNYIDLREYISEISNMLNALRKSQLKQ